MTFSIAVIWEEVEALEDHADLGAVHPEPTPWILWDFLSRFSGTGTSCPITACFG